MVKRLSVPFHRQIDTGYCLAACAQMVLEYQGLNFAQEYLARLLAWVEMGYLYAVLTVT